jgi:A/G-specific adenine glycosylase
MELGAVVCIPRAPLCLVCPVAGECRARALGIQEQVPVVASKPPPLAVTEACALVTRGGRWLIVQRGPGGLWEQFWEFPTIHLAGADPAGRSFGVPVDLAEGVVRLTGAQARIGPLVTTIRYTVTRHRVELRAYRAAGLTQPLVPGPGLVRAAWELPEALVNYPFGSAQRRLIAWAARHGAELDPNPAED